MVGPSHENTLCGCANTKHMVYQEIAFANYSFPIIKSAIVDKYIEDFA